MVESWAFGEEGEILRFPRLDPREHGHTVPSDDIEGKGGAMRRLCVSPDWVKHIIGALDRLTRSDAWIGTDDEIQRAVSNIERMMVQLAIDADCVEIKYVEQPPQVIEVVKQCGGVIESEGDMGQVVTEIKFEDGILKVYYGHCCYDELDLSGVVTNEETPGDGELTPPDEQGAACKRAYWIATEMVRFLNVMYDEFPGSLIWNWAKDVRSEMSGYKLSDLSLFKLFELLNGIWDVGVAFIDVWQPADTQRLTCLFAPLLSDNTYVLTREEYDAMKSAIKNVGNEVMEVFIRTAWDAMNYSNIERMSAFAIDVSVPEGACNCPGDVSSFGWDYKYDLLASQNGFQIVATNGSWVSGQGLVADTGIGAQGNFQFPDRSGGEYAGIIKLVEVEYYADAGTVIDSTFGYAGVIFDDDTMAPTYLIDKDASWSAGTGQKTSGVITFEYGANSGQLMRVGMRIEDQNTVGWRIARIRVAGYGEPLLAAPLVAYV